MSGKIARTRWEKVVMDEIDTFEEAMIIQKEVTSSSPFLIRNVRIRKLPHRRKYRLSFERLSTIR